MHNRKMKNSTKAKLSTREKQRAQEKQEFEVTENTRNLEAQMSRAAKSDPEQQPDDVIDLGDEVAGTNRGAHQDGASAETCPANASCDTGDSAGQGCLSQSVSGCPVGEAAEGGGCAPGPDGCSSDGAALDGDCSCE